MFRIFHWNFVQGIVVNDNKKKILGLLKKCFDSFRGFELSLQKIITSWTIVRSPNSAAATATEMFTRVSDDSTANKIISCVYTLVIVFTSLFRWPQSGPFGEERSGLYQRQLNQSGRGTSFVHLVSRTLGWNLWSYVAHGVGATQ